MVGPFQLRLTNQLDNLASIYYIREITVTYRQLIREEPSIFMALLRIITTVCFCLAVFNAISQSNKKGTIDLRHQDLSSTIGLSGTWEFYWNALLDPKDINPKRAEFITPTDWSTHYPSFGFATYRVTILLDSLHDDLAIRFPVIRSAFKLWLNGSFKGGLGTVGDENIHVGASESFTLQLPANATVAEIVVQVSNYSRRQGGIVNVLLSVPTAYC
jgi:hypothetical protein